MLKTILVVGLVSGAVAPQGTAPRQTDLDRWLDRLGSADRVHAEPARRALIEAGAEARGPVRASIAQASPSTLPLLVEILGRIGTPDDLDLLRELTADVDRPLAAAALRAMAEIDPRATAPEARRCARSRHWSVRRAAAALLPHCDPESGDLQAALLTDSDPSVRVVARRVVPDDPTDAVVEALVSLARGGTESSSNDLTDPAIGAWQRGALERLVVLRRASLLGLFAEIGDRTTDPDRRALSLAGRLLATPASSPAPDLAPLFETLRGATEVDRNLAMAALATRPRSLAPRLVSYLLENPAGGGEDSLLAVLLEAIGPEARGVLVSLATHPNLPAPLVRSVVRTLGRLPCEETARAYLDSIWPAVDEGLRALIVDLVASFASSPAREQLLLMGLEHASPLTRRQAARALASTEDPRFRAALETALSKETDGSLAADMIQAMALGYGASDPEWTCRLLERQMAARDPDRAFAGLEGFVVVALGERTDEVVESIWKRFAPRVGRDPSACRHLARVLARLGGDRSARHLEELWDALQASGDPRQLRFLLEQSATMEGEIPRRLAWAALRHPSPQVRGAALASLAERHDPALLAVATDLLPRLRPSDQVGFLHRLAKLGAAPGLAALLTSILVDGSPPDLLIAAVELAPSLLDDALAAPLLDLARTAPEAEARDVALQALGAYGDDAAVLTFLRATARPSRPIDDLDDTERHRARLAALALAHTHPEEAMPLLVRHLLAPALRDWQRLLADSLFERRVRSRGPVLDDLVLQALWQHPESGATSLARYLDACLADGSIHRLTEGVLESLALALRPLPTYRPLVDSLAERILRIDPRGTDADFTAAHLLAELAEEADHPQAAADHWERCLEILRRGHPTKRLLHDLLGETNGFTGRGYATRLAARASICRALAASSAGRDPLPELEEAVRRARHDTTMLGQAAELALRLGIDPGWAFARSGQALAAAPWQADLLDTHALAAALAAHPEEARHTAARLARLLESRLAEDKGIYHLHAAVRHALNGQSEPARRELRQALRLTPSLRGDCTHWKSIEPLKADPEVWSILEGS